MLLLRCVVGCGEVDLRKTPSVPDLLAGENLPAAPQQNRSRERRDLLLAAGLDCFRVKGFEATTIEEIAGKAGVATGGFYLYFTTKTQLLLVLMQTLVERLAAVDLQFAAGTSPRAALRRFLKQAFAADLHYAGALRAWHEAASADEGLAKKQARIQRWTTARVQAVLERLLRLPHGRRKVDVPSLAQIIDRLFWQLLRDSAVLPPKTMTRLVLAASDLLFHALFT